MAEFDDTLRYVTTTNNGKAPNIWFGTTAMNGAASPFKDVAKGSVYLEVPATGAGIPHLYIKERDTSLTTDWAILFGNRQKNTGQPMGLTLLFTHT